MNAEQDTREFRKTGLTLAGAARMYARHPSPRLLVPAAVAAVAARAALGKWSRRDARIAATLVCMEPFVEWMIHVHVLHQRPRSVKGRTFDSLVARMHRKHHENPRDPGKVFIPKEAMGPLVAGIAAINTLALRKPRAVLTGTAGTLLLLNAYEWTHFLIHSPYQPRTRLFRAVCRTHQLHHFRNEKYWFGVITPVSDKVLNTDPPKNDVPPSPTVKNLLGLNDKQPETVRARPA